jgi:hypothetical protein
MDSQQVLVEEQKWEWQAFLKVNFICWWKFMKIVYNFKEA